MGIEILDDDPLALAESARALVQTDAEGAARIAERALALARARCSPEAEVVALHALGFARNELGDTRAVRTLRAAVLLGERHGLHRRAALARRPLAVCLAYSGRIARALDEIDAAGAALDPHERARSEVFRIAVQGLAGRAPASLGPSNRALETLRRHHDLIWEARLLKNRGFLLAERGDAGAAELDLARARDLYVRLGATEAALGAEFQLARVALTRGDLPGCLARIDAIDANRIPPAQNAALELLRAKALVAAHLTREARQALAAALAVWERAGVQDPEGRLELVRLTLLAEDPHDARALAQRVRRGFSVQRRPILAARATALELAAAIAAGAVGPSLLRAGRRAAATLDAAGWRDESRRTQLSVARAALELGSPRLARRELEACTALRRRGPVADRIEGWHVEALLRLHDGDRAGAQRAARSGLRLLEIHRAALGAFELRASVSGIGAELAAFGLRIAVSDGDRRAILDWSERLRASALRLPPVTPPDEARLRERAAELRRLDAETRRLEQDGGSARSLDARRAELEASIRRLSRHAAGGQASAATAPSTAVLARALRDAALVEFVELDGALIAMTLVAGRLARSELGAVSAVGDELEWLRFGLTRLARGGHSGEQTATLRAGVHASAHALCERLISPLTEIIGDRRLVIVPTGSLHALPWSMLAPLRGRALVVAPSAATWVALAAPPRRRRRRVAVAAGPRLRHAAAEVAAVARHYPGATVLTGSAATAAAVMRAIDGATIAHLACHGRFRSDSPLFSSLELGDGPLNAYELQRLRRAPQLVILSACDLAISDTQPGNELLGLASALIGMGTRTVIASVVPVPDAAVKRLMVALHRHLTSGRSPAQALALAQASRRGTDSTLAGFVCLGTG